MKTLFVSLAHAPISPERRGKPVTSGDLLSLPAALSGPLPRPPQPPGTLLISYALLIYPRKLLLSGGSWYCVGKRPSASLRSQSLFIEIHSNLTPASTGESAPLANDGLISCQSVLLNYFLLSSNNNYEGSTPAQNPLARKRRSSSSFLFG